MIALDQHNVRLSETVFDDRQDRQFTFGLRDAVRVVPFARYAAEHPERQLRWQTQRPYVPPSAPKGTGGCIMPFFEPRNEAERLDRRGPAQ